MTTTDITAAVRLVLTVEEAADRLGIGRTLMYALITAGEVESVRIGRLRRVPADALERYVKGLSGGQLTKVRLMARTPNGASSIYLGKDGYWHGRVTVGVRDDGSPDRRHVMGTPRRRDAEGRALEKERDGGSVRKAGRTWTVEQWLTHWVENIAAPFVRENTIAGYRVAVNVHLVPGLGKHRLDRLEPEHLEKLYVRMMKSGSAPATAHQAHRTIRTALNEAVRRGHLARNPAALAKAPRLPETEVEPYSVDEIRLLLQSALEGRNGARWAVALALGLRQGEALGLRWDDVDLDAGTLLVRRGRLRPAGSTAAEGRAGTSSAATAEPGRAARRDGGDQVPRRPTPHRAPGPARRAAPHAPRGAGPGAGQERHSSGQTAAGCSRARPARP